MKYVSTRGKSAHISAAEAIKKGLADDGGLFMPETIPAVDAGMLKNLVRDDYPTRAAKILSLFLTDYTFDELYADCTEAYGETRFPDGATVLRDTGSDVRVLELWRGPTAAFKDMALQIMPRLFVRALRKTGEAGKAVILVATSGDTGKAALEGYRDIEGVKIVVFYPVSGVSEVQKLQMTTQEGSNLMVIAVNGNFDDAQNGVKQIFSDRQIINRMENAGYFFSSANSINWGRLVPQIVYYFSSYCDLIASGDILPGDKIDVSVPTGNFGNIFAGYIAKRMGLPIEKLICASNKNDILTDFINTGVYDRNREFFSTTSPSMDILISSNLERLLYLMSGSEKTAAYMENLAEYGRYEVDAETKKKILGEFSGCVCDEENTSKTINDYYKRYGYLIDTHTAVGVYSAEKYRKESAHAGKRMIVLSTASPYKFASAVYRAIGGEKTLSGTAVLSALEDESGMIVPQSLTGLDRKTVRFKKTLEPSEMPDAVLGFLGIKG